MNGHVSFSNAYAEISLQCAAVSLKNPHSQIELNEEGEIKLNGVKVMQESERDIEIESEIEYLFEYKCVAMLAKDLMTSLSSNSSPNVATAIFMPRTSRSPLSRSQAPSPSALG